MPLYKQSEVRLLVQRKKLHLSAHGGTCGRGGIQGFLEVQQFGQAPSKGSPGCTTETETTRVLKASPGWGQD